MKLKLILCSAILAIASAVPAAAADYRWTTGFGQGVIEALIRNRAGSSLNISCSAGSTEKTASLFLETNVVPKPAKGKWLDIQIVVDGKNYPLNLDDKMAYDGIGRNFYQALYSVAEALRKTKSKTFTVEYPMSGKSETFSTLNARDALGDGKKSMLDACG